MSTSVLQFTYIVYETGDSFGAFLGYMSLSIQFLAAALLISSLIVQSKFLLAITIGYFLDELVNFLLKIAIRQPRPINSPVTGYGFPSSHAQGAFFLLTIITITMLINLEPFGKPIHSRKWHYENWWFFTLIIKVISWRVFEIVAILIMATWAVFVAYSRYYLHYHTSEQVIVGCALGFSFGWLYWFLVFLNSPLVDDTFFAK